jgi:hypothetical protein
LAQKFDEHRAALYAEAQEAGLRTIRSLCSQHSIDCDIEEKSAYTYTLAEDKVSQIEDEAELAKRLGLPRWFMALPLPRSIASISKNSTSDNTDGSMIADGESGEAACSQLAQINDPWEASRAGR